MSSGFRAGLATGLALAAGAFGAYSLLSTGKKSKNRPNSGGSGRSIDLGEGYVTPPLPESIVKLLQASRLCFLATQADGDPHLSLMNFTYYQAEELIIMCTRRATKKYEQMLSSRSVAILIHDFPHLAESGNGGGGGQHGKTLSVTLNGVSEPVTESSADEARYRAIHLQNNPDYAQFIVGPDVAVVLVRLNTARMCDIKDRVQVWQAGK